MKLKIMEASGATGDCAYKLIHTAKAIAEYLAALKNSADIDDKTGEVIRDGMPKYYEGFTREDFIDPLLLALGWDVSRKRHVRIERRIDYDRVADYVLYHSTREAFAIVEAKNIHETLEKHEPQLFAYMQAAFAEVGILTNGFTWRIYKQQDDEIRMVFVIDNILEDLTEKEAETLCGLAGFKHNYPSRKPHASKEKPPSPLEDGWVET
jgi:hypothetical protein